MGVTIERTKAMMNGSWKSQDVWYGLKEGMVEMAPYTNMSNAAALAKKTEEAIGVVICTHLRVQLKTSLESLLLKQARLLTQVCF